MSGRLSTGLRALARAVRGSTSRRTTTRASRMVENLEHRQYYAVLGLFNEIGVPSLDYGPPGAIAYTAPASGSTTGKFSATATAFAILDENFDSFGVNTAVDEGIKVNFNIDSSNGSFAGGVVGSDLTVDGDVTINGVTYSGRLLEGEVSAYGFSSQGSVFDVRVTVTGGLLLSNPAYKGKDVGLYLARESISGIADPGDLPQGFASDFGGGPKGFLGPIEPAVAYASVSGFVYVDAGDDGIRGAGETPIPNTTITLTGTNNLGVSITRTTTTDSAGFYSFDTLVPGTYTITETQPGAFMDGKDTLGNLGGTASNDALVVTLAAGSAGIEYNFGELLPAPREMGSISGTKFRDLTGNGLTAEDTGLGGTTIKLFKDVDGNGKLDTSKDTFITSTVSANGTGDFSFTDLADGKYLVQEVVGEDYVRTAPVLTDTYAVTIANAAKVADIDFANFYKSDCKCELTNVYYVINHSKTVTNLRGNTNEGDTIEVFFTVKAGSEVTLTLVSYTAPGSTFVAADAAKQKIYDVDTGTFGPGTHSLTVINPSSYFQVDFVCGLAIDTFGPAGSNIFYTPQGRLISADNDGTSAPKAGASSLSGFVYLDKNNNGIFDRGEKGLSNVKVKLTGTTSSGATVTRTVYTDAYGRYIFTALYAGTYSIREVQPAGYKSGVNSVGTNGGKLAGDVFSNILLKEGDAGTDYNFAERYC